ncbi:hypothetical protein [Streptomyces sp. NPDC002990]
MAVNQTVIAMLRPKPDLAKLAEDPAEVRAAAQAVVDAPRGVGTIASYWVVQQDSVQRLVPAAAEKERGVIHALADDQALGLTGQHVPAVRGGLTARPVRAQQLLKAPPVPVGERLQALHGLPGPLVLAYGAEWHGQDLLRRLGAEEVARVGKAHVHRCAAARTRVASSAVAGAGAPDWRQGRPGHHSA